MIVDHDGNIIDAAYVHDNMRLFECYRVNVVRQEFREGQPAKIEIVGIEDYQEYPTMYQKMYCLAKYKGDYATVERVSTLEYLPFTEIGDRGELPDFLK